MIGFAPFPAMETERLTLRKIRQQDAEDFYSMRKDPRMHVHTDTKPDANMDETTVYMDKMNKGVEDNKWIIWAMEHKQLHKVIGSISIWNMDSLQESGELGFGMTPDCQGQGLMKEALLRVVEYGFKVIGLKVLEAYTEENNVGAIRLLEKCGFMETNRVDDEGCLNDQVYHMVVYRLERGIT